MHMLLSEAQGSSIIHEMILVEISYHLRSVKSLEVHEIVADLNIHNFMRSINR